MSDYETFCMECQTQKSSVKRSGLRTRIVRLCAECTGLAILEAGDVVNITNFRHEVQCEETVERTTKKLVVMTTGHRYRKSDGRRIGHTSNHHLWMKVKGGFEYPVKVESGSM